MHSLSLGSSKSISTTGAKTASQKDLKAEAGGIETPAAVQTAIGRQHNLNWEQTRSKMQQCPPYI